MDKWSAGIDYDDRRLGHASIYGLRSREEAVAWLQRAFVKELVWYKQPSCWIRQDMSYTKSAEIV